jgi:hypothetical protein
MHGRGGLEMCFVVVVVPHDAAVADTDAARQ